MIHFEEITPNNWRENLRVAEAQKHYVARDMYEKLGFFDTGEADEDEIIMKKKLR